MPDDRLALSKIPQALPAEADYDAICAAVMTTVRGRWFLEEYAKRNRQADTAQVLAAIERLETAMAGDCTHQASQSVRIELLEMARAIAQTRAAVAEAAPVVTAARAAPDTPNVAAAAERLRDIAWSMRACGVELATSEQIEELAQTILSASALHDPADHRAQKLGEVLQYLEFRIDRMLDSHVLVSREAVEAPAAVAEETPVAETIEAAIDAFAKFAPDAATEIAPEPPSDIAATIEAAAVGKVADSPAALTTDTELELPLNDTGEPRAVLQIEELRVERVELELEPLAVVPAGEALRESFAREAPSELEQAIVELPPATVEPAPIAPDEVASQPDRAPIAAEAETDLAAVAAEPETDLAEVAAAAEPEPAPATIAVEPEAEPVAIAFAPPDVDEVIVVDVDTLLPFRLDNEPVAAAPTIEAVEDDAPRAAVEPEPEPVWQPETNTDAATANPTVEAATENDTVVAASHAVATQFDQDLDALGVIFTPAAVVPAQEPQASAQQPQQQQPKTTAQTAPAEPPPESEVLVDAWQIAVTKPAQPKADTVAASPHEPVPSMWVPSVRAEPKLEANDDPADFLLEPLSTDTPTAPRAAPSPSTPPLTPAAMAAGTPQSNLAASTASTPAIAPALPQPRAIAKPMPHHIAGGPLAALTAMSDEERIALFT